MDSEKIIENWKKLKESGYSTDHLEIKYDPIKGMGVYAKRKILKDEIVEYCHSMVYGFREKYILDPVIMKYSYRHYCECEECKNHGGLRITPFGFGSIYNSADDKESRNIDYMVVVGDALLVYFALRDIKEGEELLAWFGQGYYDNWCKPRQEPYKEMENKN